MFITIGIDAVRGDTGRTKIVIDAVRGVRNTTPGVAVIVLTEKQDIDDLLAVVRAGAIGYLPVASDPELLHRVVHAAASGEAVISRSLVVDLIRELHGTVQGFDGLTAREAQVLGMLRRGRSTAASNLRTSTCGASDMGKHVRVSRHG